MYDIELVTREERTPILDHMKQQLVSTLTEIYERCGGNLDDLFYDAVPSMGMGICDKRRRMYWEAIVLYNKDPKNWSFPRLAQCIIGKIFNRTFRGMDEGQPLYPLLRGISFSFIDVHIEAVRLEEIHGLAEIQGYTPEEIMTQLNVPDAFRSVYRKALAQCKTESEEPAFQELAGDIFRGLRCRKETC